MRCPNCGLVQASFASGCPRCARTNAQAPYAPGAQHLALVLSLGGGAVVLVFALFLMFRISTGTLDGPKSPFGDNSTGSFNMSSSSNNSSSSYGNVPPSIPMPTTPATTPGGSNWHYTTPSGGGMARPSYPSNGSTNLHISGGFSSSASAVDTGVLSTSLTRKKPIHATDTVNTPPKFEIVEDHAEQRGNAWFIVGKVRSLTNTIGSLKLSYEFYDDNGQGFSSTSNDMSWTPSISLNAGAEASFEFQVPFKSARQYDDVGFMLSNS